MKGSSGGIFSSSDRADEVLLAPAADPGGRIGCQVRGFRGKVFRRIGHAGEETASVRLLQKSAAWRVTVGAQRYVLRQIGAVLRGCTAGRCRGGDDRRRREEEFAEPEDE